MDRRTLLKAGLVAPAATIAGGTLAASPTHAAPRRTATLASGLEIPWGCDFFRDGSALVTLRNSGKIVRVSPRGGHRLVGTVPGVFHTGEGGLMGLALSPSFYDDRWVYVMHTTTTDNRVVRMRYADGRLSAPEPIITGIPAGRTHNGGGLLFSGGSLFVLTGDTRDTSLAQNRTSLAGKILRLKPDGSAQDGNPFIGTAGDDRIFTFGHRNPQGIAATSTGALWATELGENTWDELNAISLGNDYGWPASEGGDGAGGATDPYSRWHPADCSPSGIAVASGRVWIGALRGQSLWSVDIVGSGAGTRRRHFQGTFGRIRMVRRAPDGSLWIGTSNSTDTSRYRDRVYRIAL